MGDFLMPSLGADMDAGTIVEWRVAPGDTVQRGDVVAVVDTEKSDIEVEVFEDGEIEELLVVPGQAVPVGTPLARIASTGTSAAAGEAPMTRTAAFAPREHPAAPAAGAGQYVGIWEAPPSGPHRSLDADQRVHASPRARRRAAAAGIDLHGLTGTGPAGAVVTDDVERAQGATGRPSVPPDGEDTRARLSPTVRHLDAMRRTTGNLMARSKATIPHYYLATTVDLLATQTWLDRTNGPRPPSARVLPAAVLLKATARAAAEVPGFNGWWKDGFHPATDVHLGVAISLRGGGLVAPAICNCDTLSLDEVMSTLRDLVERARAGHLRSSEVVDPTLTVTNLGDQGADEVHGVIYPPQVALVGFGRVQHRPWAADGMLGVRPTVRATLAADHRVSDGREGSRFLAAIDRLLQTPEDL